MTEGNVTTISVEQQLLSKEAIKLPPKERLNLLLKAKRYPIVKKRTSAEGQIKEMIDFYNLLCLMLAQYFPNEQAENNFFLLSIIASQGDAQEVVNGKLAKAFRLLHGYEELENRITAIQWLFHQYEEVFPDIYQHYNLEDIAFEQISDIVENSRQLLTHDTDCVEKLLERWELS